MLQCAPLSPATAGRRNIEHMATRARPLLGPGNEAEWAEINREKQEYQHQAMQALTPSERIAEGQKLSQQAVSLLASVIRGGNVPRRAFWS